MFEEVKKLTADARNVLIIEDSSHEYENTLNVLNTYAPLIPLGGYFIVEDGICYHGLDIGPKPGPYEAIETFVSKNKNFEIDIAKESFILTWNPKGFLKRIS
jgi:cephalosporin hydroxylase